jgi:hypothetical protein
MKIDPNSPAFAAATCGDWNNGISVRAHFASMAMQGYLSAIDANLCKALLQSARACGLSMPALIAQNSVDYADALIHELNK